VTLNFIRTLNFEGLDLSGDGKLSFIEVLRAFRDMDDADMKNDDKKIRESVPEKVYLSDAEYAEAREAFSILDKDKNGTITLAETKQLFGKYGYDGEFIEELLNILDTNNDGRWNFIEILKCFINKEERGKIETESQQQIMI